MSKLDGTLWRAYCHNATLKSNSLDTRKKNKTVTSLEIENESVTKVIITNTINLFF